MKNAKKLLALVISMLMIVAMFSIVPMGVSAEDGVAAGDSATASRLDDWKGNITTTLVIGSSGSHADVDEATGYHLYPDVAELYVGDSIKTDDNWLNYDLNYTIIDAETNEPVAKTGKITGNAEWYCDDAWKFSSQLTNGKINGWADNNPKTFDQAGTWKCVAPTADGNITLTSFEVNELPRFFGGDTFKGNIDVSVKPGEPLDFSTTDIFVGDKLVNGGGGSYWKNDWPNVPFTVDGVAYTGGITNFKIVTPSGNTGFEKNLWMGGSIDYVFTEAGTYTVYTTMESVKDAEGAGTDNKYNVELCTFEVQGLPRIYKNLDGSINYTGPQNVTVKPTTTIEFSTYDLYVGDKLVQGYNGWWTDYKTVQFTLDGVLYKGNVTHLHINTPSGNNSWYGNMWHGGTIDYVLPEAGTYTIVPSFENVTAVEGGAAHANVYDFANWKTFEVKECPHNFELTETVVANCAAGGYELYTCSYCGATEKRNETEITGEHNFVFTETIAPTCTAKGYDIYTCDGCNTTEQRNETEMAAHNYTLTETVVGTCTTAGYELHTCSVCEETTKLNVVIAPGHELTKDGDTVSCAKCDYTNTYTGEAVDVKYDLKDLTGLTGYTTAAHISAFVGDTLTNASNWWSNHTFTYGELSGKVYNIWVVKGDIDYFNEYREARLANGKDYVDENVTYIQIGYGNTVSVDLDEAGTYTIVAALECYEGSNFLTNIEPVVIGTVEVFDVPEAVVEGDIDGDKEVTAADLIALQQHVLGITTIEDTTVADINKDGVIDAVDLVLVQIKILGL